MYAQCYVNSDKKGVWSVVGNG